MKRVNNLLVLCVPLPPSVRFQWTISIKRKKEHYSLENSNSGTIICTLCHIIMVSVNFPLNHVLLTFFFHRVTSKDSINK